MTATMMDAQRPVSPQPPSGERDALAAAQAQLGVNRKVTPEPELVPCTNCSRLHPPSKTGLCRECFYKSDWPLKNAMANNNRGQQRKRDPDWQRGMIIDLVKSAARRAKDEDPGVGLANLLAIERAVKAAVKDVGTHVTRRDGPALVAEGIGTSKQNAEKRWGVKCRHCGRALAEAEAGWVAVDPYTHLPEAHRFCGESPEEVHQP